MSLLDHPENLVLGFFSHLFLDCQLFFELGDLVTDLLRDDLHVFLPLLLLQPKGISQLRHFLLHLQKSQIQTLVVLFQVLLVETCQLAQFVLYLFLKPRKTLDFVLSFFSQLD